MDSKTLGGIFLVVGISIGAGVLALPITTAEVGFFPTVLLLLGCWLLMTVNSLLILETNLWFSENSNLVSMAKVTLGPLGAVVAWVCYLLLFYSLLAAYISAGTDLSVNFLGLFSITIPEKPAACLFTLLFAIIVYQGTSTIDRVNKLLVIMKFISFFALISLVLPHVKYNFLAEGNVKAFLSPLMVIITSFGFASIIPSLRSYFHGDAEQLVKVIVIGSLIPLFLYIIWELTILGALPLQGSNGLEKVVAAGTTSSLIFSLKNLIGSHWITSSSSLFSGICVTTSFLGVGLALSDFLADGLQLRKKGLSNLWIYLLTYLPPLLAVLYYPTAFIKALSYAGTFCTILLAVLPGLMVWRGRYQKKIASGFQLPGGRTALSIIFLTSLIIAGIGLYQELGL